MREKSRFLHEDTHSRVKPCSGTNTVEGGERCAFCSWKYRRYFELLQTHTHTHTHKCLIKCRPEDIDGKCRPDPGQRRESKVWPVAGMRAPAVGGTVAGGQIMPAAEMRACAVGETEGC